VMPMTQDTQGFQSLHGLIDLAEDDLRQILADATALTADQIQELFRIFSQAEDAVRLSPRPRFVLEAAAVRAARLLKALAAASAVPGSAKEPRKETGSDLRPREAGTPSKAPPPTTIPSPSRSIGVKSESVPPAARAGPVVTSGASPISHEPSSVPADRPSSPSAVRSSVNPATIQPPAGPSDVALAWEQVVEEIERRHPNIGPFLAMGTLLAIEGRQVTIGYPRTASIAFARIQKDETLQLVTSVCSELAGESVRLRVTELTDGQPAPPSLAQLRASKKQSQQRSLLEQARSHPFVKQALEIFGGEVVEVRPTSPQEETS
ncbi:MAG: hypothetical protein ACREJU_01765, partial [Nitrospiraceae bacterium]